jgi:hypothetical protein
MSMCGRLYPSFLKPLSLLGSASTVVNVEGNDLTENDSTFHTDVDRDLFNKLPLEEPVLFS